MTNDRPALPVPHDNLFGICNAVGEDVGFNPLYLRVSLAALLLWNPVFVIAAYALMGVAVLATRLVFPRRSTTAVTPEASIAEPMIDYAEAA